MSALEKKLSDKEANVTELASADFVKGLPTASHGSFHALSLYEKKSYLVNRELDKIGFGYGFVNEPGYSGLTPGPGSRYQWCIFLLCGFGYFLDLAFAQLSGLILAPLAQEMGVSEIMQPNIYTAMNVGLTVGAFFWGLAVDIWGRRICVRSQPRSCFCG